jgi:acylphosphatase
MARITGRVQGVGFRWWTRDQAIALGLGGWVRNERDGSVTALISGPDTAVATMTARLQIGPPGAAVTGVTTEPAPVPDDPDTFLILR